MAKDVPVHPSQSQEMDEPVQPPRLVHPIPAHQCSPYSQHSKAPSRSWPRMCSIPSKNTPANARSWQCMCNTPNYPTPAATHLCSPHSKHSQAPARSWSRICSIASVTSQHTTAQARWWPSRCSTPNQPTTAPAHLGSPNTQHSQTPGVYNPVQIFLFLPHINFLKISAHFFFFHISVCGRFPHFSFLQHFSLWKISTIFFSTFQLVEDFHTFPPSTYQFVKDFHMFLFLPYFSLWKISTLFPPSTY